jgi:single-stranded DNA-binding protein
MKGSAMDLNLVVIAGRIAAEPDIQTFESGATLMRLLVTVRSEEPRRRLDVIPVVQWNPDADTIPDEPVRGRQVWVVGALQRRFWSTDERRLSKVEIVAHEIAIRDEEVNVARQTSATS